MNNLAGMIDHTLLKADATEKEILRLCDEAEAHDFHAVCVNPVHVAACAKRLAGTGVAVCTVIGFPLGASTPAAKAFEAREAAAGGADELDMVMNIGALKQGSPTLVLDDIRAVRAAAGGKVLKVIIETGYLSRGEKVAACLLAKEAGADFVKTSTGFGPGGATVDDVRLLRETAGDRMGVKASGGIRTAGDALALIAAGASRIGTSHAVAIVRRQSTL